jgi:hypothetical protein
MRKETEMANFDLNAYETVEQRHARALEAYPDLRCVIVNHTCENDRAAGTWVVEARVYLTAEDQAADLPKATEWAFEVDGVGMANKTSALENAATSALGRSLRWALGGSKGPSREEMAKVERGVTPKKPAGKKLTADELLIQLAGAGSIEDIQRLYEVARAWDLWSADMQAAFSERKAALK